jgi:hypothetical protein
MPTLPAISGEPHGLPQREVPRHHGQHHAERLVADVRPGRADLAGVGRLVGQQLLGVLRVVAKTLGALERFRLGRLEGLAHLQRHHGGHLVGLGLEQVGGGVGPLGALGERGGVAVVEEAFVGAGDGGIDFCIAGRGEGFDRLAGCGVDGGDGHAGPPSSACLVKRPTSSLPLSWPTGGVG